MTLHVEPLVLTSREAAAALRISTKTLWALTLTAPRSLRFESDQVSGACGTASRHYEAGSQSRPIPLTIPSNTVDSIHGQHLDQRAERAQDIQFVAGDGKRRSIRLGADVSMEEAREIKKHVECSNAAAISGEPWKRDLALGSASSIGDSTQISRRSAWWRFGRTGEAGPVPGRLRQTPRDVEPATIIVFGHTRRTCSILRQPQAILGDIEVVDVKKWRAWLTENQHLAENTVNRRCGIAKQFFKDAVSGKMLDETRSTRSKACR